MRTRFLLLLALLPLSGCALGALVCHSAGEAHEEKTNAFERVQCPEGFELIPGEAWCSSSADCPAAPGEQSYCEEGSCLLCRPE